jgi:predicted amidohydrolase YtcJ
MRHATRWCAGLLLAGCTGAPTPAGPPPADLVLCGGRVVTLDPAHPRAEALAATGGRIVAVGSDADIASRIGPATRVIELAGRLAIPGFIEGHAHLLGVGRGRTILDCRRARTWDALVAEVAAATAREPDGTWIVGRGWHQEKWERAPAPAVEGLPTHAALSAASPRHPVLLTHASGHLAFANARALALAGITATTPDPPGGTIVRDGVGAATGALRETAAGLVARAQAAIEAARSPAERRAEQRRWIALACEEALQKGITTFHDAGSSFAVIDLLQELAATGALPLRLYVMVDESNEALARGLARHRLDRVGDGHLTVRAIKRYVDGALGSHGAWLLAPYDDQPGTSGANVTPVEALEATAALALRHGFQLCTHAIGDRGNRETLDFYERAWRAGGIAGGDSARLRWRIEHAQHVDPADVPRFAALGVIASMQGVHCVSDGPWVPKRLGRARARATSYAWRSLLDAGAVVSNGTDAPVEDLDPLACFHATVTRAMADRERFFAEQCLTREEALASYTRANAFAAFEEDVKGRLAPGLYADVTVLDRDILTCAEDALREARVDCTIVGGVVRYERAGAGR